MEFCIECGPERLSDAKTRAELAALGVRSVSVGARELTEGTREDVKRLRDALQADDLCADTSHPPFGSFNQPFSLLRQAGRDADIEWMKEYILRCGLIGVKAIPLHTGGAMLPLARPWETECALSYVRALLPAAEEANVILAIENTNHATPICFYEGAQEDLPLDQNRWQFDDTSRILDFVAALDSPYARICFDTGHSHLLLRMLADAEAFLPHCALFHLHDNDGAGNDAHLQPGYGNAPWRGFFDLTKRAPKDAVYYVEAAPRFHDLELMLSELRALFENRVRVKKGGFLEKDEEGKIRIWEESI